MVPLLLFLAATLLASPVHAAPADLAVQETVVYSRPGAESLSVDVRIPAVPRPVPAVLLIHGGGWTGGSRAEVAAVGRDFEDAGFATFAIDYRLAPQHPFPAALEDARAAVRWIRANARRYGVDPTKIVAFGSSAGGHLAALVATVGRGPLDRGSRVRAAASWSGPMDLEGAIAAAHPSVRGKVRRMVNAFLGCGKPDGCAARRRAASPISWLDPSDPPLMIVNSANEALPLAQAEVTNEALDRLEVPHRTIVVPGRLHADAYRDSVIGERQETVLLETLGFLYGWVDGADALPRPAATGPMLVLASIVAMLLVPWRRLLDLRFRWLPDGALLSRVDELAAEAAPRADISRVLIGGGSSERASSLYSASSGAGRTGTSNSRTRIPTNA